MYRDWMKRNFWRSKFMFRFTQRLSRFLIGFQGFSVALEGLHWFSKVLKASRRLSTVFISCQWFSRALKGSHGFSMVFKDSRGHGGQGGKGDQGFSSAFKSWSRVLKGLQVF